MTTAEPLALPRGPSGTPGAADSVAEWVADMHRDYPDLLSREEEHELGLRAVAGDVAARDSLICHNWRLVLAWARRYQTRGLELADLVQYGNLGLWQAVARWEPERNLKLSTYAVPWIRQAMQRGIEDTCRTIRLPAHIHQTLGQLQRGVVLSAKVLRGEPLTAALGPQGQSALSLDTVVWQDEWDELTIGDRVADDSVDVEAEAVERCLASAVGGLVGEAGLTTNEQRVVVGRFGLGGGQGRTLDSLARELDVSRERIRQIETAALVKLRQCGQTRRLWWWTVEE